MNRGSEAVPRTIVTTAFRIREPETPTGFVEVLVEGSGARSERIILDPTLLRSNLRMLKKYSANIAADADDLAQKEEIPVGETAVYSNVVHFSQMGGVAETNFGVFSLSDWVEATRNPGEKIVDIQSADALRLISTTALQKKLLNELMLLMGEET